MLTLVVVSTHGPVPVLLPATVLGLCPHERSYPDACTVISAESYAHSAQAAPKPYLHICLILFAMPSPLVLHSQALKLYTYLCGTLHVA